MNAYSKAIGLLQKASTDAGFLASTHQVDNYKRIWTRDGVVNGLAALLSSDDKLINTFRSTLHTIFTNQHATGFFPSNVTGNGYVSYGGTVGRVDNVTWAIIGLCEYSLATRDMTLATTYHDKVMRGFALMDAWEFNAKHLMYVPQSADWADEYMHHGYVLFDQLLRVWALKSASKVYENEKLADKANIISKIINDNFWKNTEEKNLYAANLAHQMPEAPGQFWLMGFNPSGIYHQFDLQANSLALLLNIGSRERNRQLISFLSDMVLKQEGMVPSFDPPVTGDDWHMHELKNNFAFSFRNRPGEFHNGGLWPVWNGLFCLALAKWGETSLAKRIYEKICTAVELDNWNFNECFHAKTLQPAGVPECVWSAGGTIIAGQALEGKQLHY